MFKPDGYVKVTYPNGERPDREVDTHWCAHCGRHTHLKPGEPPYATCKLCMGFICAECYHKGGCKPHEQMLLEMEGQIERKIHRDRLVDSIRRGG